MAGRIVRSSSFLAVAAAFGVAVYEVFFHFYFYCDPRRAIPCYPLRWWQLPVSYRYQAFGLIILWTAAPLVAFGMAWYKADQTPAWTFGVIAAASAVEAAALRNEIFGQPFATYVLPFMLLALLASMIGFVSRPPRRQINYGG